MIETYIENSGLLTELNTQVLNKNKPVLGICLGMQLLMDKSEEGKLTGHNPNAGKKGLRVTVASVETFLKKYIIDDLADNNFEEKLQKSFKKSNFIRKKSNFIKNF